MCIDAGHLDTSATDPTSCKCAFPNSTDIADAGLSTLDGFNFGDLPSQSLLPSISDATFDQSLLQLLGDYFPSPIGLPTPQWPMQSDASTPLLPAASLEPINLQPAISPTESKRPKKRRLEDLEEKNQANQVNKAGSSQRPHYAVESRYRSTLNEKYAALTRALSSEAVQRICRTLEGQEDKGIASENRYQQGGNANRQQKTATLSETIDTINILNKCCAREEQSLLELRRNLDETKVRIREILVAKSSVGKENNK